MAAHISSTPTIPETMRAWQLTSHECVIEKDMHLNPSAPVPAHDAKTLGPSKVLVHILASAINPADYKLAQMSWVRRYVSGNDAIPGCDFAGEVVAIGTGHKRFKVGQLVFGFIAPPVPNGTLQEYVVLPSTTMTEIPDGVEVTDAAAVGGAGMTAYQSLHDVRKGDTVFINGGSGGTGTFEIQFAKALGCFVIASCSAKNAQLCKSLGADEVIDYRSTDVVEALTQISQQRKIDLVVDNIGGLDTTLYWKSGPFMSERGRFVQIGNPAKFWDLIKFLIEDLKILLWPRMLGGGTTKFELFVLKNKAEYLDLIGKSMQEGKVKPVLDEGRVRPFDEGAKAFEKLKTGRTTGKIVLQVSE